MMMLVHYNVGYINPIVPFLILDRWCAVSYSRQRPTSVFPYLFCTLYTAMFQPRNLSQDCGIPHTKKNNTKNHINATMKCFEIRGQFIPHLNISMLPAKSYYTPTFLYGCENFAK